jgi:uncharacterized repeat protein (TIGR01451 family)
MMLALLSAVLPLSAVPVEGGYAQPERIILAPPPVALRAPCVDCVAQTDLYVRKGLADGLVAPGEVIEYKISVGHEYVSNATARDVIITDTLPLSVTYVSQSNDLGFTPVVTTGGEVVWTRPFLNPNESGTIYMQVRIATSPTVKPGNTLFNTIEITSSDPDIDNANNTVTDFQIVVAGVADVSVSKELEPSTLLGVPQGEEGVYKITFENGGHIPATDVVLTDTLPSGMTFRAWSSDQNVDAPNHQLLGQVITPTVKGQNVAWHLGDLAAGRSGTIYAVAYVSEAVPLYTVLTNTVYMATSAPEDVVSNNWVEKQLSVYPSTRDVALVYKDLYLSGLEPLPDRELRYEIAFQQGASANAPARGVVITDTLPLSATFVSWSSDNYSQDQTVFGKEVTVTLGSASGQGLTQVAWHIGTLRPGRTAYLYPVIRISDTVAVGTVLTNTAYITSTTPDGEPIDQVDVVTTTFAPDVGVNKVLWSSNGPPGGDIEYQVLFGNSGGLTAYDVVVTDTLPQNTGFVSWDITHSYGWSWVTPVTVTVHGNQVAWRLGTLAPGQYGYLYPTLHISETASPRDTLTNVVHIATREVEVPNGRANIYTDTSAVVANPIWGVNMAKRLESGVPVAGGTFAYRLTFQNDGNMPAHDVVMTDTLPAALSFQDWTGEIDNPSEENWADTITMTQDNGQVIWQLGTLQPGQYGYLYPVVRVTDIAQVRDVLCNHAEISTSGQEGNVDDNVVTDTLTIYAPLVDVAVSKWMNCGPSGPEGEIAYSISLYNHGNVAAEDIVVTDTLPVGTTYVADYAEGDFTTTVTGTQVVWHAPLLAGEQGAEMFVRVRISDKVSIGDVLTNTVVVATGSGEMNLANNTSIHTTAVATPTVDLLVSKSGPVEAAVGGALDYHMYVYNAGNWTASDVIITDTLPEHTTYLSDSVEFYGMTPTVFTPTVMTTTSISQVVWHLDALPACAYGYLYLHGRVQAAAQVNDVLTNTIVITSSDQDLYLDDNTSTATTRVTRPTLVSRVFITGPLSGTVGTRYAFTATAEPPTATMPIEYVWQATEQPTVTVWGDADAVVEFIWETAGPKHITVTAEGGGNVVVGRHSITLSGGLVCTQVTAVDLQISDPLTLYTNTPVSFTANITPDHATKPYTYFVTVDGTRDAAQASSEDPLTFRDTFTTTGVHTVTIAAWNCAMTETDAVTDIVTFTVDAPPACIEVTDVTLDVFSTTDIIYTDTAVTFTTAVTPSNATQPYTYRLAVDGVTSSVQTAFAAPLTFSDTFTTTGVHTVTIAAWNCAMTETDAVTDIVTFTVYAQGQCVGLDEVAVVGPNLVTLETPTTFNAVITPSDATFPVTYTWHPVPDSGQGTSEATYQWADPGFVTLTLTAENCDGSFTARHLILVSTETSPINPLTGRTIVYTHTDGLTTTIEVPAGGVIRAITLVYTPIPSDTLPPPPTGLHFSQRTFDLSAFLSGRLLRGFIFSKPVTITLRYSDADIRGLDESELALYYWDEGPSQWVDAATNCPAPYIRGPNLLAVPICHLSHWGMMSVPLEPSFSIYLPLVLRHTP